MSLHCPGYQGKETLGYSLQLVTWLVETEVDRWLVKIVVVAPSQRNLADLTTPGFPHLLFPSGIQRLPFRSLVLCSFLVPMRDDRNGHEEPLR